MHSEHFLSRRSTILTRNDNWQPVVWPSNRRCGASFSEFLEGNITPVLNLRKGCSLPFLPEEKQSNQKTDMYLVHLHLCL